MSLGTSVSQCTFRPKRLLRARLSIWVYLLPRHRHIGASTEEVHEPCPPPPPPSTWHSTLRSDGT